MKTKGAKSKLQVGDTVVVLRDIHRLERVDHVNKTVISGLYASAGQQGEIVGMFADLYSRSKPTWYVKLLVDGKILTLRRTSVQFVNRLPHSPTSRHL